MIPQTLCGDRLAALSAERTGRGGLRRDQDPLDVCVLTEKTITHGDILLQARPIGGFRMLDGAEADDKIIAVLDGDAAYGGWRDIRESPSPLIERLKHYFLTYKDAPDSTARRCEIAEVYDAREAKEVITRCHEDYRAHFGGIEHMLTAALRG